MGKKQYIDQDHLLRAIYQKKVGLLKLVLDNFWLFGLKPKIGIELEFYLEDNNLPASHFLVQNFICHLKLAIKQNHIEVLGIEPEQGCGQIEVKTKPYFDIELLCAHIIKIKDIIVDLAKNLDHTINFSSQPYPNDCGSSLQINFSLFDKSDRSFFLRSDNSESKYLLNCVAGLLKFANINMIVFVPQKEDYLRFDLALNKNLYSCKKYTAPVNISWGYDNRTAMVRIPATNNASQRRLEFRLASSDVDIYMAAAFFLLIVLDAIKNNYKPAPPIYGNAFDERYELEGLIKDYSIARDCFFKNNKILDDVIRGFAN